MTDWELIQRWTRGKSEPAFRELVERHAGFVFASARRQLGDAALADDVTQAAFLLLARKASSFREGIILPSWLFRTTRFLAARAQRSTQRRERNESEAAMIIYSEGNAEADQLWRELSPHIDEALASLSEADRQAMLLRFFQRKSLRDVATALGLSEDAAKKRVSRALEKLRAWLQKRGVAITANTLALVMAGRYAEAAPAAIVAHATTTTVTPFVAGLLSGAGRDWFWATQGSWVAAAAAALLITTAIHFTLQQPAPAPPPSAAAASINQTNSPSNPSARLLPREPRINLTLRDKTTGALIPDAELTVDPGEAVFANGVGSIYLSDQLPPVVHITVEAPGHVRASLMWLRHEFTAPTLEYTCLLEPAQVLAGSIRDQAGRPISSAKFICGFVMDDARRDNIGRFEFTSDEQGQFRCEKMPGVAGGHEPYTVWITHPEFLRNSIEITSNSAFTTNHSIILTNGVVVRGIVLDDNGIPFADAVVECTDAGTWPGFQARSGPDGQFVLGAFEPGTSILPHFWAEGFGHGYKNIQVTPNLAPVTLELTREAGGGGRQPASTTIQIVGRVHDAISGQPIDRFKVFMFLMPNRNLGFLLGESANGAFDWTMERSNQKGYTLAIEAPGYAPAWSTWRDIHEGAERFQFQLQPGDKITGYIIKPDGEPAAGAEVWLRTPHGPAWKAAGNLVSQGANSRRVLADDQGRFALESSVAMTGVVGFHETGFALLNLNTVTNVTLQLRPWSAIQGIARMNGRPVTNELISLASINAVRFLSPIVTKTDAQGFFTFDRIPAGQYEVRGPSSINNHTNITLLPDEIAEVTLTMFRP